MDTHSKDVTFHELIDILGVVGDSVSIIDCAIVVGYPIFSNIDWYIVKCVLEVVQQTTESKRCHLQPTRSRTATIVQWLCEAHFTQFYYNLNKHKHL